MTVNDSLVLGPADDAGGVAIARPGTRLKCLAIFCFAAMPFACAWTVLGLFPEPPSEQAEKIALFDRKPQIDTIVVGDSRVCGIAEEPFAAKGWNYFDMGLSGVSPEDMAMQLKYAMLHRKIRRVVIGVSFEGMAARYPFDFSRYHSTGPLATAVIVGFATVGEGPRPPQRTGGMRKILRNQLLPPIERASVKLRWLVAQWTGGDVGTFRPDGTMDYKNIHNQIAAGDFNFARERDPKIYYNREDSETRYLEKPELAPFEEKLYRKVFAALREAKIACVAFETGRSAAYQKMIDADPNLARLQLEWREFFKSESHDRIKFLDAAATRDCYAEDDFFDAVHFIGETGTRLATRLADELAAISNSAGP